MLVAALLLSLPLAALINARQAHAQGAAAALGQTGAATPQTDASYVPKMTFDVAPVRENKDVDVHAGITMSGGFVPHTTTLRVINLTINNLIGLAYGVDQHQIVGAPMWPWPTVFVVEARGDSAAEAKMARLTKEQQLAEQNHMLQGLLEERFSLKTHWETKEGDVYNLVVAKGRPKLGAEGSMPPAADEQKMFGDRPVPSIHQKNDGEAFDFIAHGSSMSQWAETLGGNLGGR